MSLTTFRTLVPLILLAAGANAVCPIGSIRGPARLSCYKLYSKPMAWLDAEGQCRKDHGHLASIPSTLTNAFLQTTASSYGSGAAYWTGGGEMDGWSWIDGSRWSFTKWAKGQPIAGQNCMSLNAADGLWYSADCTKTLPFLCSVPDLDSKWSATPPPNVPTAPPSKPCPVDWTFFPETNLCYGVVSGADSYDDSDAADMCADNDGALVSITSIDLNNDLTNLVLNAQTGNNYVRLGLHYNSSAQQWQWVDGRATTFTNWGTRYPISSSAVACARMSLLSGQLGMWINDRCDNDQSNAVVCERAPGEYQ